MTETLLHTILLVLSLMAFSPAKAQMDSDEHGTPEMLPQQKLHAPLGRLQRALERSAPLRPKTMSENKPEAPAQAPAPKAPGMMDQMGQMMKQMMPAPANMPPAAPAAPASSNVPQAAAASAGVAALEPPNSPVSLHVYHLGAREFFIDQAEFLKLTSAQSQALRDIRDRSILEGSLSSQKIKVAEEQLWTLTAADSPKILSIESKVKEIEALRGAKRITFIRNVGQAASVLTVAQKSALLSGAAAKNKSKAEPQGMGGM